MMNNNDPLTIQKGAIKFSKLETGITIRDALQGMAVREVVKTNGMSKGDLVGILTALIQNTASYYNIGKNITTIQAVQTASMLLEKYEYESIQDFILCFKTAKMGEFGKVWDRIDGAVIFEWMDKYLDYKAEKRESIIIKENRSNKQAIEKPLIDYSNPDRDLSSLLKKVVNAPMPRVIKELDEEEYQELRRKYFEDLNRELKENESSKS